MNILITANTKKYFNTYIDFIDHYWLNYFEKKKINFKLIPNSNGLFSHLFLPISCFCLCYFSTTSVKCEGSIDADARPLVSERKSVV